MRLQLASGVLVLVSFAKMAYNGHVQIQMAVAGDKNGLELESEQDVLRTICEHSDFAMVCLSAHTLLMSVCANALHVCMRERPVSIKACAGSTSLEQAELWSFGSGAAGLDASISTMHFRDKSTHSMGADRSFHNAMAGLSNAVSSSLKRSGSRNR